MVVDFIHGLILHSAGSYSFKNTQIVADINGKPMSAYTFMNFQAKRCNFTFSGEYSSVLTFNNYVTCNYPYGFNSCANFILLHYYC